MMQPVVQDVIQDVVKNWDECECGPIIPPVEEPITDAILTEDDLFYMTTEDGLFYLKLES